MSHISSTDGRKKREDGRNVVVRLGRGVPMESDALGNLVVEDFCRENVPEGSG